MKIISWNVNGIRAIFRKDFEKFLYLESPDILAVQETKAKPEQLNDTILKPKGYKTIFCSAEKLGYSGVAVFVREGIDFEANCGIGIKKFDSEGRTIVLEHNYFIFLCCYFPNSQEAGKRLDYKLEYCDEILKYVNKVTDKKKPLLICGDYNIAHKEIDLANPDDNNKSPGFLPEERAWMDKFISNGYIDTFRLFNKEPNNYTWWSYRTKARERNIGWRIDYHCVNNFLLNKIINSYHHPQIMGSDHCPVSITF